MESGLNGQGNQSDEVSPEDQEDGIPSVSQLVLHFNFYRIFGQGPSIAQSVKMLSLSAEDCRFEPYWQRVVFWYWPLASHLLKIAIMVSEHHTGNDRCVTFVALVTSLGSMPIYWLLSLYSGLSNKSQVYILIGQGRENLFYYYPKKCLYLPIPNAAQDTVQ